MDNRNAQQNVWKHAGLKSHRRMYKDKVICERVAEICDDQVPDKNGTEE